MLLVKNEWQIVFFLNDKDELLVTIANGRNTCHNGVSEKKRVRDIKPHVCNDKFNRCFLYVLYNFSVYLLFEISLKIRPLFFLVILLKMTVTFYKSLSV